MASIGTNVQWKISCHLTKLTGYLYLKSYYVYKAIRYLFGPTDFDDLRQHLGVRQFPVSKHRATGLNRFYNFLTVIAG